MDERQRTETARQSCDDAPGVSFMPMRRQTCLRMTVDGVDIELDQVQQVRAIALTTARLVGGGISLTSDCWQRASADVAAGLAWAIEPTIDHARQTVTFNLIEAGPGPRLTVVDLTHSAAGAPAMRCYEPTPPATGTSGSQDDDLYLAIVLACLRTPADPADGVTVPLQHLAVAARDVQDGLAWSLTPGEGGPADAMLFFLTEAGR